MNRAHTAVLAGIAGAQAISCGALAQPGFLGLGSVPGAPTISSSAFAVSADGSTVVGTSSTPYSAGRAFRWTAGGGMEDLRLPPTGPNDLPQMASGCSPNGRTVVGALENFDIGFDYPFYWQAGSGATVMTPWEGPLGVAVGVTDNLGAVVGWWGGGGATTYVPFIWRPETGWTNIAPTLGVARAVTPDGIKVVGNTDRRAFLWTPLGGIVFIGPNPSQAIAVTPDGAVVVGCLGCFPGAQTWQAFRWTAQSGAVPLGDLPGGAVRGWAFGVSADGLRIVGRGNTTQGDEAFIYEPDTGMRNLREALVKRAGLGPLLQAWILRSAYGISADGTVIAGTGTNPNAPNGEAWRAVLPRCPGDYNRDGVVSPADVTAFVSAWFQSLMDGNDWGDFDLDGVVTPADVAAFVKAWWVLVTTGGCQ